MLTSGPCVRCAVVVMLATARTTQMFMRVMLREGKEELLRRFLWIGEDDWRIGPHAFGHMDLAIHPIANVARTAAATSDHIDARDLCANVSGRLISISPKVKAHPSDDNTVQNPDHSHNREQC